LFHWDGQTCLPKAANLTGELQPLADIPTSPDAKAEGIAILDESSEAYTILIVFDGPANGRPSLFKLKKS
jgi:hypothetical protein